MDMDVIYPSSRRVFRHCGFSLIELLISISLGMIVMGMAVPAFSDLLDENRQTTYVNELVGTLHYARSEAVMRKQRVNVCKSPDGMNCDNTADWNEGWISFVDLDADRQHDAAEKLLRVETPDDDELDISYNAFPSDNYVIFYPTGMSMGNGTFVFCDGRGDEAAEALVLFKTGRLRSADIMPNGDPLTCPD